MMNTDHLLRQIRDFHVLADRYGVPAMPVDNAAPYPVPSAYFRDLCQCVADPDIPGSRGQREAARMLKVGERIVRYWCSDRECPWSAAELLRRMIIERGMSVPDPTNYRGERRDPPMEA
jgi:hypothetical protein